MSWLNANDYMVMDLVARDRAEELLGTSVLASACVDRDERAAPDGPSPAHARARWTGSPCYLARAVTARS